jgi:SAM-dependent methyltransferase
MHSGDEHWTHNRHALELRHKPHFEAVIKVISKIEPALEDKVVLDYGCNLGGFLKLLFEKSPFQNGIGIDIDREAIEQAQQEGGNYPIQYVCVDKYDRGMLDSFQNLVNIAVSIETIHLVADIVVHAQQMNEILKVGGSYYAVRSFHRDPKVREKHREKLIRDYPDLQDFTPDEVAVAFERAAFDVNVRLLPFDWFAPCGPSEREDYNGLVGMVDHYSTGKLFFRFTKKS